MLQRQLPQVGLLYLVDISNISIQVCGKEPQGDGEAAARGVGLSHRPIIGEVFKPESRMISFFRMELSCLPAGRLGTLRCQPVLRRGQLSLA